MSGLEVELVTGEGVTRLTVVPDGDGTARLEAGDHQETVALVEVPAIVGSLIELGPRAERDEEFSLTGEELDALVTDGLVRMLALQRRGAEVAEAVVFEHQELGFFVVAPGGEAGGDGPPSFEAVTIRPLDVWTIVCGTTQEVCPW